HRGSGLQPGLAALDVEELLGTQVGAEARFGDDVFAELQRGSGRDDRIAAVRDVGEGSAMDEGGVVLQRLHQVRLHRVLQKHRHRAVGLDVAAIDRRLVAAIGDNDVAEALLQVFEAAGKAEDRHYFGRHGYVEARLAREAVRYAAERHDDVAQRAIVHVHHAPPGN